MAKKNMKKIMDGKRLHGNEKRGVFQCGLTEQMQYDKKKKYINYICLKYII